MAKEAAPFGIALPPRTPGVPVFRWLYSSIRAEILDGRLRPGTRLPSTRDLAHQYGLARGTIVNAFEQLKSEGYIDGNVGSGTYVSNVLPEKLLHVASRPAANRGKRVQRPAVLSDYARAAKLFPGYDSGPIRAFRANLPALDLFPTNLWSKITARCLRNVSIRQLIECDFLGYMPLREAVTEYLTRVRGVRCVPEQVAIVSGVQEALDVAGRLLLNPGDRVCVEDPGYPGAVQAFQAFGAKVLPAVVDDEGANIDQLPSHGTRLIYVTPGHQFPLGTSMSLSRRLMLLKWARETGAVIFEDDYDSEYRYSGRPTPSLQGLDEHGVVFYAGSFTKVLFPALRLGYVVIPQNLIDHVEAILSLTIRHAPMPEQLVLTEFMTEGHFGRHLRRMREVYAERLSVLLEEARHRLEGLLEISNIEAGLQTAGWLCDGISAQSAVAAAAVRKVHVTSLASYSRGTAIPEGLQLGFAALAPNEIRRGVRELAVALENSRVTAGRERSA